MNTAGLEWFGPPERNTLHPLCVVLPCLERVCESLGEPECVILGACPVQRALPFLYLKGGAYMAAGSPTDGPNDVV